LQCRCSKMVRASTAMQATYWSDMSCSGSFQTSHRLGPSMSITCTNPHLYNSKAFCSLYRFPVRLLQHVQFLGNIQYTRLLSGVPLSGELPFKRSAKSATQLLFLMKL